MSFRTPPNKGVVEFPVALHVRCTQAMLDEFKQRGGGRWLRALIAANTRPPAIADDSTGGEGPTSAPAPAGSVPHAGKIRTARRTRGTPAGSRATKKRRVALDSKKRSRV